LTRGQPNSREEEDSILDKVISILTSKTAEYWTDESILLDRRTAGYGRIVQEDSLILDKRMTEF
jgi:hypothetical protein